MRHEQVPNACRGLQGTPSRVGILRVPRRGNDGRAERGQEVRNEEVGEGNPIGFPTVFKPRILIKEARKDLVDYVLATARMMGKNISRQDAEGIALAIETGGILITADRKQAEVADRMGAKVLYTIPTKKLPVTLGRSP